MIENLAMQYLTGHLVVSYRTINRFRIAKGMEELIRNLFIDLNLRLKMEELVTLDCLFIDGTKIEANANKYSFVWKKSLLLSIKLSNWIHKSLSPQSSCLHSLKSLKKNWKNFEETPVKGKDERKTQRHKLKKVLRKVKEDFSVRAEKYENYQETFEGRNSFSKIDPDATFMRMKEDHMKNGQLKPGYNV